MKRVIPSARIKRSAAKDLRRVRWSWLAMSLCLASSVTAQRPNLLAAPYTEAMTWTDISAAIDGGRKAIIIPTGGVEQNGPALAPWDSRLVGVMKAREARKQTATSG